MTSSIIVDSRFESDPAKVVWKYTVPLQARPISLMIPVGSRMVHVEYSEPGFADREFLLWYEVELKNIENKISHVFQVWGTGDETIPHVAKHIGTVTIWNEDRTDPQYVWHLYEYPSGAKIVEI